MIVVAVLSGVFFWAARFTLREKDSFPDSRGHTYAPKSSVRFSSPGSSTAISTTGLSMPKRSSSVSLSHRSSTYRPSAGVSRVSAVAPMRTTSGILSSTRSTMSASSGQRLYSSSSKQIRSYGATGAGTASAPTATQRSSRTSYAQGGTGSIGIATPTLSYQRRTTTAASDIAQDDNTVASAMALNSTAGMRYYVQGPFTAAYNTVDNYSYYNPANSTGNGRTKRKTYYHGTSQIDGEGYYYDEDLEDYAKAPTGTSNITGLGAGTFVGQEAMYNGCTYRWDGSKWILISGTPSEVDLGGGGGGGPQSLYDQWLDKFVNYYGREPNDDDELEEFINWWLGQGVYTPTPIGDGLWILLLLAMAIFFFKRHKKTNSNQLHNLQ